MQQAADAAERLAAAHRALKADPSIQFSLQPAAPPPQPPKWLKDFFDSLARALKPVGRFMDWVGSFLPDAPYARAFLWIVLAAAAALVLWMVYERFRHGEWRLPRRRRAAEAVAPEEEEGWAPEAAPARSWLREADALAAEGRYAEAVRHLLFRSIEDIQVRRPRLVRPALTSRELAAASAIPSGPRQLFARIAALVERSLFGGREVGAEEWGAARKAYADFVLPGAWRG
ncbi:MAG: DUF4129 domain-containing protein [Alphaproteobacteria bacterium]|nr:DUF4129 domain-containing protein [Alphaproteobacteria bacterium]MBV9370268.1 DUF4129 domain-containing protein [Alphaproteobacteria bacterium]MBV9899753.1 DUF4129 domain-containing protein [Alphaproteobacteria bacterium]